MMPTPPRPLSTVERILLRLLRDAHHRLDLMGVDPAPQRNTPTTEWDYRLENVMSFRDGLDEEFAPGWRPDIGEEVEGIVDSVSSRDGGYGTYPILTLRTISGADGAETFTGEKVAVHCMGTVLQGWVEDKEITRGDRVVLRYNGKKTSAKSGAEFHDYSKNYQPAAEVPARLQAVPASSTSAPARSFAPRDDEPF